MRWQQGSQGRANAGASSWTTGLWDGRLSVGIYALQCRLTRSNYGSLIQTFSSRAAVCRDELEWEGEAARVREASTAASVEGEAVEGQELSH